MKRVNQYQFYQAGSAIHPLTELRDHESTTHGDIWFRLYQADSWMKRLLEDTLTPLFTCRASALKLQGAIAQHLPKPGEVSPETGLEDFLSKPVPPYRIVAIRNAAKEFETVFSAELETTDTYYVSKKGIYSTNDLIERAQMAFPEDVRAQLSDDAICDVKEAGKCLAFDLSTASGFHIIRATESLIHKYYVTVTASTPKRKDRNWGAYVRNLNTHLKKIPGSRVDPKLVALIDQVREHHRNPVMHPEVTLTGDEALSLFGICQSVVIAFAGGLKALQPVTSPLPFPTQPDVLTLGAAIQELKL